VRCVLQRKLRYKPKFRILQKICSICNTLVLKTEILAGLPNTFWYIILQFLRILLSAFRPRGSLDRRVNCRRVPQPRWVGARRSAKGGKPEGDRRKRGNPQPSCLSRAQVGCACSRGLQASAREGARGLCARRPVFPRAANPL
jgi:hypothetical protein